MFKKLDLIGQRYGNLLVLSKSSNRKNNHILWNCICDCGNKVEVTTSNIRSSTKSCGCLNHKYITHGKTKTKAHRVWMAMKTRCNNKSQACYKYYGGKGIQVCQRWSESFEMFLLDMGEPSDGMTLDRIDVNGNYEPANCRWADSKTQSRNRSDNRNIEFNGVSMCMKDWADKAGIAHSTMQYRIKNWPLAKALTLGATK